ncbi:MULTISPECIES: lipopolysaccharide assembly protein LapB [unclassified Bacteroides]|jgi:tetratricopeptide (TPR) repeat protein|uniref:tetratricopeptide repeat protein n=1 Tax=unclassified Bacteroides TaxID=2646097 RepID=UPI000E923DF4|nr:MULTISPECIES: tetratricopeptide repeat protein [unclassified Bacteroides]RGN49938.1 tetratricopeptide repeat protein [Bacteroides sp. OM05-12]RHR81532.1 tetratricopeptide repeat protein [Bacteroides sp. AF16-49]
MKKVWLLLSIFFILSCSGNKSQQATLLYEQGKEQEERGAVDSAVVTYNAAINLLKQTDDKPLLGEIYNRIGDLYLDNDLEPNAFQAFQTALKYNSLLTEKSKASYSLRGMGKSYIYRLMPDSALHFHLLANQLIPQIKDTDEIANIHNNLSNAYLELKNYDTALAHITKALFFCKDSNNIYSSYSTKASIFIAMHQYDSALIYLKKGIYSSNIYTQAACYLQLSRLSKMIGDPNYTAYLENFNYLNDSIDRQNQNTSIANAEQNLIKKHTAQEKRLLIICIIGILIISSLGYYLVLHYNKKKINRTNKQLQESKITIQEIQSQLQAILANIKETGETCTKEFIKSKEYPVIKDRAKTDFVLSYKEQEQYCTLLLKHFDPYIRCLANVMSMSKESYYLCCLFLIGFNTKECANFRGISTKGLRTQKGRIFKKIKELFGTEITFEYFFNLPEKQVNPANKSLHSD